MGFLDDVLPAVRAEVDRPEYLAGLPDSPRRSPASFRRALETHRAGLACVVEYKRVSPGYSADRLPERSMAEFVRTAEAGGASAFSCLACVPKFEGSPRDVLHMSERTRLPVLFKDFVVSVRQVEAARRSGAAAVLLIARLETERRIETTIENLAREAHRQGLETLLELHLLEDLAVAARVDPDVVGVNARDLDTLRIDRSRVEAVFKEARRFHPLLGLSGVAGPEDAVWFRDHGADGFLVGTAAAQATDPEAFISRLSKAGAAEPP